MIDLYIFIKVKHNIRICNTEMQYKLLNEIKKDYLWITEKYYAFILYIFIVVFILKRMTLEILSLI